MPYTYIRIGTQFENGQTTENIFPLQGYYVGGEQSLALTKLNDNLQWTEIFRKPVAANANGEDLITIEDTYQDLPAGPSVTVIFANPVVSTNLKCLVTLSCSFRTVQTLPTPPPVGNTCSMSFEVSGATTIAANDENSISGWADTSMGLDGYLSISRTFLVENINAGTNVFVAKYKRGTGDPVWVERRSIVVQPLPVN